jgi:Pyruvate/2-oxoacid:ferredoxin oxidoreductase delta subunit
VSGSVVTVDGDGATTGARLFAGGDLASLDRTVSHAIGSGTRAARAIHARLSGVATGRFVETRAWTEGRASHVVAFDEINVDHLRRAPRAVRPELPAPSRTGSFAEVVGGLDGAAATAEARRCFTCGHCITCDVCFLSCPDMAIGRLDDGYRISLEHCKGCGVCSFECPRGALCMENER